MSGPTTQHEHPKADLLELLLQVTAAANRATDTREAIETVLGIVCEFTGWPVGHAFMVESGSPARLVSAGLWHFSGPEDLTDFREATEAITFTEGKGLPGRVWASGEPSWIVNLTRDPNCPRTKGSSSLSGGAGFALPVIVDEAVVAILEFFSREIQEVNENLLRVLQTIGVEIGHVVERERIGMALKASESRYVDIYNITPAMMHSIDRDGRIISVSDYWLEVMGRERDEVLGQYATDFLNEESRRYILEVIRPQAFEKGSYTDIPLQFVKKNGDIIEGLMSTITQKDSDGNVIGALGVIKDVTELKKAQWRAHVAQSQFMEAIERMPEGVVLYDAEDKFVLCNRTYLDHLDGIELVMIPGLPIKAVAEAVAGGGFIAGLETEKDKARWVEKRMEDHRTLKSPIQQHMADGTWVLINQYETHDGGTFIIRSDITEIKLVEEALRDREERLRAILDTTADGIITIDARGHIQTFNQAAQSIFGYSLDEVRGRNISMLMGEPEQSEHDQYLKNFLDTGIAKIIGKGREVTARRKDRAKFPLYLAISEFQAGGQRHFTGIVRDLSERKRIEELLSTAIETMPEGFALYDTEDKLVLFNQKMLEFYPLIADVYVTGMTFEEILRTGVERGQFPDAQDQEETWIAEHLERHRNPRGAVQYNLPNGRFIRVEEWTTRDGGTVGIRTDITELKEAQNQMQLAKEAAERANQAKSAFLSAMSHELRPPMNAILGFAQLLQHNHNEPLSKNQKEYSTYILNSGEHLLELIDQVLDLAQVEAGKLSLNIEDVAPEKIIADSLALIAPHARERNIKIVDRSFMSGMPKVRADYTRFKQVLLNLLSNGVKYNREGGTLTVTCELGSGGVVRFNVSDTGEGIPKKRQRHVFEPFNRLGVEGSNIKGTGIGLTITKQIVELMEGRIGFRSVEGEGTTFWFELPITSEKSAATQITPTEGKLPQNLSGAGPARQRKVLYIDDSRVNLRLMEEIIACIPRVTMVTAPDAEQGLELAKEHRPNIILMDINLPRMDGYKALECLRASKQTRSIPVIALTANALPKDIERGRKAGFSDYVIKPFNITQILMVIEETLDATQMDGEGSAQDPASLSLSGRLH